MNSNFIWKTETLLAHSADNPAPLPLILLSTLPSIGSTRGHLLLVFLLSPAAAFLFIALLPVLYLYIMLLLFSESTSPFSCLLGPRSVERRPLCHKHERFSLRYCPGSGVILGIKFEMIHKSKWKHCFFSSNRPKKPSLWAKRKFFLTQMIPNLQEFWKREGFTEQSISRIHRRLCSMQSTFMIGELS